MRWRRDKLPTPVFLGFPCGSAGKESASNVGDLGSIPGSGRSPGEGKDYPLQYSCRENPIERSQGGLGWKSLLQGIRGADRAGFGARVFPRTKMGRREVEEALLREPLEEERRCSGRKEAAEGGTMSL